MKFNELTDDAKDKAREWWRTDLPFDTDHITDDAANIAAMFGLDIRQTLKQTLKQRADKTYHWVPSVYWSGFWNQGDGASFDGSYKYKVGGLKAVKAHAPRDETLHRIVRRLQDVQRRYFYGLRAEVKQRGRYRHEMTMEIAVTHWHDHEVERDDEEEIIDCLRDFARWIYRQLETEYEYQNSDEVVDEMLIANEYEFDEDGKRA